MSIQIKLFTACYLCLIIPDLIHWNDQVVSPGGSEYYKELARQDISTLFALLFFILIAVLFVSVKEQMKDTVHFNKIDVVKIICVVPTSMYILHFIFDKYLLIKANDGIYYNRGSDMDPRSSALGESMIFVPVLLMYFIKTKRTAP